MVLSFNNKTLIEFNNKKNRKENDKYINILMIIYN